MDKKDKVLNVSFLLRFLLRHLLTCLGPVSSCALKQGKPVTHYFVKWVNNEKPIWEPASNLSNCDAAIAEFERQRREDRTPQEVEQPKKRAKKRNESDESGAGRKREERMEEEMVVEIKKKGDFDPVMAGNESDSSDAKTVPIRRSPSVGLALIRLPAVH